jgi:4-hydroxybenzoate polyprenyltransferase
MRPHQWVKNVFVPAPLLFSKHLLDGGRLARAAGALVLFCLLSGAVYIINDIVDVEQDRAHPKKRNRPIASGQLPIPTAKVAAIGLCLFSLGTGFLLGPWFVAIAASYFVLILAYSLRLKHVVFLDIMIISAGFLLRVVAGAAAIDVEASPWLLACTGLLACFLGFGKRYHELASSGQKANIQRAVLARYRLSHLEWIMHVLAVATVCTYAMYTLSDHTVEFFHTKRMVWSTPFIGMGVLRFQWLVVSRPDAESPTNEMLRDKFFLVNSFVWVGFVTFIIYFAK